MTNYDELVKEVKRIGNKSQSLYQRDTPLHARDYLRDLAQGRASIIGNEDSLRTEELERLFYLIQFADNIYNNILRVKRLEDAVRLDEELQKIDLEYQEKEKKSFWQRILGD